MQAGVQGQGVEGVAVRRRVSAGVHRGSILAAACRQRFCAGAGRGPLFAPYPGPLPGRPGILGLWPGYQFVAAGALRRGAVRGDGGAPARILDLDVGVAVGQLGGGKTSRMPARRSA